MSLGGRGLDLQIGKHDCLGGGLLVALLRASILVRDPCHKGVRVVIFFLNWVLLHSLNLVVQLLHESQLFVGNLVLFLEFIVLKLKTAHGNFEKLVFALALHGTLLVEFMLGLLIFPLFLHLLDLLSELLLFFRLFLRISSELGQLSIQSLDLFVFLIFSIIGVHFIQQIEQLLLFSLHLHVVGLHVLILVALHDSAEFVLKTLDLVIQTIVELDNLGKLFLLLCRT